MEEVEDYPEYIEEDYSPEEEATDDAIENQAEISQEAYSDTSPSYKEKDDLYSLFWKVVRTKESSKVGNLDPKTELGMLDISVRDNQRIALLAMTLGHPGFAKFFLSQGEIILSTSASKKGWLPELFVSQRKFSTKAKEIRAQNLPQQQPRKSIFKRWAG